MYSCSGERRTSSYPVSDLTPTYHGKKHSGLSRNTETSTQNLSSETTETQRYADLNLKADVIQPADLPLASSENSNELHLRHSDFAAASQNNEQLLADAVSGNKTIPLIINSNHAPYNTFQPTDDTVKPADNTSGQTVVKQKKDKSQMNGFGIVSLVTGIISLYPSFLFLAPVAIIFGAIGLNKRQRGLAVAGMVLGIVSIVFWGMVLVFFILAFSGGNVY